jgi:UDP-N-acetylmuramate dehydrogenase
VVLEAAFQLVEGDSRRMAAVAASYLARRRATQPAEPSAGSIFRNPAGDHAGRLIEATGLKGQRAGGAQISTQHANFIVNIGGASAADVLSLVDLARLQVQLSFGAELAPEILFIGEWTKYPPYASLIASTRQ